MFDVPGYALVMGGERNGQYVKAGVYYRRSSDGTMYRVDTGTPAAAPKADPAPAPAPAPKPEPEITVGEPEKAAEPEAKPMTAADRAAMADGLVNDFTAEELTAKAIALASERKLSFKPKTGDKAARHAAAFLAKHAE